MNLRFLRILLCAAIIAFSINACGKSGEQSGVQSSEEGKPAGMQGEVSNKVSVPGTPATQKAPFSKETLKEIKEREAKQPATPEKQRVIPFHKTPAPIEQSPSEAPKENKLQSLAPPKTVVSVQAPNLSANFTGLGDNNTVIPPDTMGAVGPDHIMETLNSQVGFFLKDGAFVSSTSLQNFWASLGTGAGQPANYPFDPKILYDQFNNHFVFVTMGGTSSPNSWLMIGVSQTSDPTGTWCKWAIDADKDGTTQTGNWADFPGLGIDANNVYVTANMFNNSDVFQYAKVWVIPSSQLYSCSASINWTEFSNLSTWFTLRPAHVFGSSSAEYLVNEGYVISGTTRRLLRVASINSSGAPVFTGLGYIEVASYPTSALPGAPQLGSSNTIETNDTRLLNSVYRNGYLWTTHHVADDTNIKTEIAWYQIDPAAMTLTSQGRISDASIWYYYPSIAVNANNAVGFGFSGSSSSSYASAYYTAKQAGDPSGTMPSVALLKSGLASYYKTFGSGENRWGDYSATCIDPNDDLTFWTVQEFASTPSGIYDLWGTWWGTFAALEPVAPSGLTAVAVSSGQINLSWTDNSTDETGFQIERKTATGSYAQIATVGANVTAYSDISVIDGTAYTYRVSAFNANGSSSYSNGASATTPLNAPTNLTAGAVSSSQINLSWTDNSSSETGFKIERKTGVTGTYAQIATVGANVTTYSDTGLSSSTSYYYRVRAYNSTGNSSYSNEASATTQAASGGGGGGGGGCSIGARQNTPTAIADLAVMLMPLLIIMILRRKVYFKK